MRLGLLAFLLALPGLASAQNTDQNATRDAVQTARAAVRAQTAGRGVAAADLADLVPTDIATDRRSGATFVTLTQRVHGLDVWGTATPVAVPAQGAAVLAGPTAFEGSLATRATAPEPTLSAGAAVGRAEAFLRARRVAPVVGALSDEPASDAALLAAARAVVRYAASEPRLVYQPVAGRAGGPAGALRLAWAVTLDGGLELWAVRVDAATGAVLAADDLVAHDTWGPPAGETPTVSFAPLARARAAVEIGAAPSSYRVFGRPTESPAHGAVSLVVNPADAAASPRGWHDTGAAQYTVTRGNNAYAYTDREPIAEGASCAATPGCNLPDAGSSPDGGAALIFDTPFDASAGVGPNAAAAVVNLFYWGNVVHDVTWQYGFDEAAGNFQTTNAGEQGRGGDAVLLEALDGSGTNNANFSTPRDGGPGRMQMYEWTAPPLFEIAAPAEIAGPFAVQPARFGAETGRAAGTAVVLRTAAGLPSTGCTVADAANRAAVQGNVAVMRRGGCNFVEKARTAGALGATAFLVYNCDFESGDAGCASGTDPEALVPMGCPGAPTPDPQGCRDVTILGGFVQNSTGLRLVATPGASVVLDRSRPSRDSDFDAGVVAHEYGHGVSARLVGGPSGVGCLGNAEQMGEGWSDILGLLLTQRTGDTGAQARGIGTYLGFESTSGRGIRNAPYSTSFAVNDYTYQDVLTSGGTARALSTPHGVGFVWASILYDLTWNLIDAHGFSADVYDARGAAGNLVALNLVTTGLKLTPCGPGFVSGRDAILAADRLLYPDAARPGEGRHYGAVWRAFARRGVGVGASQGLATSTTDGTASFALPGGVAAERSAEGVASRLVLTGPNPFTAATTLALTLDAPQHVRVDVLDGLGRRVAVLHDGPVAAGEALALRVAAAGLPSGVYVVRAASETAVLTKSVTVVR